MADRLPKLMRAYLDGTLDLESFMAEIVPLYREEGWAPYFDQSKLTPEQRLRAEAFERGFRNLGP